MTILKHAFGWHCGRRVLFIKTHRTKMRDTLNPGSVSVFLMTEKDSLAEMHIYVLIWAAKGMYLSERLIYIYSIVMYCVCVYIYMCVYIYLYKICTTIFKNVEWCIWIHTYASIYLSFNILEYCCASGLMFCHFVHDKLILHPPHSVTPSFLPHHSLDNFRVLQSNPPFHSWAV